MKPSLITSVLGLLTVSTSAQAGDPIQVLLQGSSAPVRGASENFTGTVFVESRFQRSDPARTGGAVVTFEQGARTAWHSHPLGQTLIVTSGHGFVQSWGEAVHPIKTGDVVWIPPGVKHWHGATANSAMTHIAISEVLNGKSVDWMEKVSDDQYPGTSQ